MPLSCCSKFGYDAPCDITMIGETFAFVFHSFRISILMSRYLKMLSSSSSLTLQSRYDAASIIVNARRVLLTTAMSGHRAGITFVRISMPNNTFTSLLSITSSA